MCIWKWRTNIKKEVRYFYKKKMYCFIFQVSLIGVFTPASRSGSARAKYRFYLQTSGLV
jgi:hypothetical protein